MVFWLTLVPSIVLLGAAEDAKKDLAAMEGTWTVVTADRGNRQAPAEALKKMQVVIRGESLTINEDKDNPKSHSEKVTIVLDPSTKPKSLDMVLPADKKGENVLGIYELDGDSLKLCWRKSGGKRPSEFSTKSDSELGLLVLKRAKKE